MTPKRDKDDQKRRDELRKEIEAEVTAALANDDGFKRLINVSDAEWKAAAKADAETPVA